MSEEEEGEMSTTPRDNGFRKKSGWRSQRQFLSVLERTTQLRKLRRIRQDWAMRSDETNQLRKVIAKSRVE